MGSIGIISLTTRRNRRFFISAEHYPVVKVRPTEVDLRRSTRDRSSPAIRWSVACRRAAGHGSGVRWLARPHGPLGSGIASGGPELFCCAVAHPVRRIGGDEETRTPDPLLAKETLCQLSYVPEPGLRGWWAFLDSNQRPLPYQGSALTS